MRFIDTHCHAHFNAYKADMDEVIRRSLDEGVFLITVGTQSTTSKNGLAVAEKYDGVWTTIGLHPNHTCEQEFWDEDELPPSEQATPKIRTRCEEFDPAYYRELAKHPKVVAIGECGLDYYRIPEGLNVEEVKAKQEREVRKQFDLATEVNLPLVIHCRDAHVEQQAIIREYVEAGKLGRRGVVHCFTGTLEELKLFYYGAGVEYNFYNISFRAGLDGRIIKERAGSGITCGFGLRFGKITLDYAFVPYYALGQAHLLTLSFDYKAN